jgi:ribosomal-protein-alanine N-acetyltransferase
LNTEINKSIFNTFPELESMRLNFQAYAPEDAEELFAIRSNPEVMRYMDSHTHETLEDSRKMIERIRDSYEKGTGINWTLKEKSSGRLIGDFGFWRLIPEHCRAEIGYVLHPDYWGMGYMQETFYVMMDFAFKELRVHSLEANVNVVNKASMVLLERNGFKQEAYFRENFLFQGRFLDSRIYCLLESDWK